MFNILGKDQEDFFSVRVKDDISTLADEDMLIWDAATDGWVIIDFATLAAAIITEAHTDEFASGTRMIFWSSSAPTGWTQNTALHSAVMRIVNSTGGGTGGADGVLTVFGSSKSTANHTLSTARIPSHDHSEQKRPTSSNRTSGTKDTAHTGNVDQNTGNTGGGGNHSHDINNMDLKYLNVIRAEKD